MIALPVDIREELIAAACLLPIAVANLRSPLSTVVTCSDANPVRAGAPGVTKAAVSRKCAEALFLHSVHKGQYTRLDWGPDDWSPQVWEGHHLPQVLSEVHVLQKLSGGTRSQSLPAGDGSLERDLLGNRLAKAVASLC